MPMRAGLIGLATGLVLVMVAPATPASAQWSDSDQVQDVADGMYCVTRDDGMCFDGIAQTFTVGVAGSLTYVDLLVNRMADTTQDLVIEIRDDTPEGALLATSEPVPPAAIPVGPIDSDVVDTAEWITFTIPHPLQVDAGDVLALVVQPTPQGAGHWGFAYNRRYMNVYFGGHMYLTHSYDEHWSRSDGHDLAFTTWVQQSLTRFAGPDRFATAAETAYGFSPGVPVAYIATGYNFPDALTGGPAAAKDGGPVLLTRPDRLPDVVAEALEWLEPGQIRILGGTGVVSNAVRDELKAFTTGSVTRLAGADRYATAAAILDARFAGYTGPIFVATGANFPDALAGGAAAAAVGAPVILATWSGVPDVLVAPLVGIGPYEGLTPTSFVLLGGTGVLGSGVVDDLKALFPGIPVSRWSGADRYATSAAIGAQAFPGGADTVYLATGVNFPDALAGVPLVSLVEGPLLLTRQSCLPPVVATELERLGPVQIAMLGGTGVVSEKAPTTVCD